MILALFRYQVHCFSYEEIISSGLYFFTISQQIHQLPSHGIDFSGEQLLDEYSNETDQSENWTVCNKCDAYRPPRGKKWKQLRQKKQRQYIWIVFNGKFYFSSSLPCLSEMHKTNGSSLSVVGSFFIDLYSLVILNNFFIKFILTNFSSLILGSIIVLVNQIKSFFFNFFFMWAFYAERLWSQY